MLWKRVFCRFLFIFFVIFNSKGLNCKRDAYVLRFLRVLGGEAGNRKKNNKNKTKQKKSGVPLSLSLEWLNNALFGKEIAMGLALAVFRIAFSLSDTWMSIYPFIIRNLELLHVYMSSISYWSSVLSSVV